MAQWVEFESAHVTNLRRSTQPPRGPQAREEEASRVSQLQALGLSYADLQSAWQTGQSRLESAGQEGGERAQPNGYMPNKRVVVFFLCTC